MKKRLILLERAHRYVRDTICPACAHLFYAMPTYENQSGSGWQRQSLTQFFVVIIALKFHQYAIKIYSSLQFCLQRRSICAAQSPSQVALVFHAMVIIRACHPFPYAQHTYRQFSKHQTFVTLVTANGRTSNEEFSDVKPVVLLSQGTFQAATLGTGRTITKIKRHGASILHFQEMQL